MQRGISPAPARDRLVPNASVCLLAALASLAACSPGELDCARVNVSGWCGKGGTGGGGGGMGGAGGMDYPDPSGNMLTGCASADFKTVTDFEMKFLGPRCAKPGLCHIPANATSYPPDLGSAKAWMRLRDKLVAYPMSTCNKAMDKYVDTGGDPANSFLVSKVRDKAPKCPNGAAGGAQMPFAEPVLLTQMEIDCMVAYAKAIAVK